MSGSIVVFNSSQFNLQYTMSGSSASGTLPPNSGSEQIPISGQNAAVFGTVDAYVTGIDTGTVTTVKFLAESSQSDSIFDEDAIYWKEFRSKFGKKYEIGYQKKYDLFEDEKLQLAPAPTKEPFGISVVWTVATNQDWINTPGTVRRTSAITRYALYKYNRHNYAYLLYITNTLHYNYYFYDETGDYYQINCFRNGDHWVRYNSEKPEIIYFSGS